MIPISGSIQVVQGTGERLSQPIGLLPENCSRVKFNCNLQPEQVGYAAPPIMI